MGAFRKYLVIPVTIAPVVPDLFNLLRSLVITVSKQGVGTLNLMLCQCHSQIMPYKSCDTKTHNTKGLKKVFKTYETFLIRGPPQVFFFGLKNAGVKLYYLHENKIK